MTRLAWAAGAAVSLIVALLILVGLLDLGAASSWLTIVGFVLAVVSLTKSAPSDAIAEESLLDIAVRSLRGLTAQDYRQAQADRGMSESEMVPIQWHLDAPENISLPTQGQIMDLPTLLAAHAHRGLALVGETNSGKTSVARMAALEINSDGSLAFAAYVLNISLWDSYKVGFRTWAARQVMATLRVSSPSMKRLTQTQAELLVTEQSFLLIDGFDDLPDAFRENTIRGIIGAGLSNGFVMLAQPSALRDALLRTGLQINTVIHLEEPSTSDANQYLRLRRRAGERDTLSNDKAERFFDFESQADAITPIQLVLLGRLIRSQAEPAASTVRDVGDYQSLLFGELFLAYRNSRSPEKEKAHRRRLLRHLKTIARAADMASTRSFYWWNLSKVAPWPLLAAVAGGFAAGAAFILARLLRLPMTQVDLWMFGVAGATLAAGLCGPKSSLDKRWKFQRYPGATRSAVTFGVLAGLSIAFSSNGVPAGLIAGALFAIFLILVCVFPFAEIAESWHHSRWYKSGRPRRLGWFWHRSRFRLAVTIGAVSGICAFLMTLASTPTEDANRTELRLDSLTFESIAWTFAVAITSTALFSIALTFGKSPDPGPGDSIKRMVSSNVLFWSSGWSAMDFGISGNNVVHCSAYCGPCHKVVEL